MHSRTLVLYHDALHHVSGNNQPASLVKYIHPTSPNHAAFLPPHPRNVLPVAQQDAAVAESKTPIETIYATPALPRRQSLGHTFRGSAEIFFSNVLVGRLRGLVSR